MAHVCTPQGRAGAQVGVQHVLIMLMQLLVLDLVDVAGPVVQDGGRDQCYHV